MKKHISLEHKGLRNCKNIGYEFYYEELFVVKQKSKYSCECAIYVNLSPKIIEENCDFDYFFHNFNIKPSVLDGGDEIGLASYPWKNILNVIKIMISQFKILVSPICFRQ